MSKYPHNYLLNNWLSYKNIQSRHTLTDLKWNWTTPGPQRLPGRTPSNISANNAFRHWRKCLWKMHLLREGRSFKHWDYPHSLTQTESSLHLVIGRAFQCVLSLFLVRPSWDKTCFLLLISLFICCRYWKCKLWVDQKNLGMNKYLTICCPLLLTQYNTQTISGLSVKSTMSRRS